MSTSAQGRELSNAERTVALYASDMPTRFRYQRGGESQLLVWIAQGVERLGADEVRRAAEYLRGYWLLSGSSLVSVSVEGAHTARFPKPLRLRNASSLAAVLGLSVRGSVHPPAVEGECACGGTGWVALDWGVDAQCPVHGAHKAWGIGS